MCTDVGPHTVCVLTQHEQWNLIFLDGFKDRMRSAEPAGFAVLQFCHSEQRKDWNSGSLTRAPPGKLLDWRVLFRVPHICDHLDEVGLTDQFRWSKSLFLLAHLESIQVLSVIAISRWIVKCFCSSLVAEIVLEVKNNNFFLIYWCMKWGCKIFTSPRWNHLCRCGSGTNSCQISIKVQKYKTYFMYYPIQMSATMF